MAWRKVNVGSDEFLLLKELNKPISRYKDDDGEQLYFNEGIEVISALGSLNAIYDAKVGIRQLQGYNPQFKNLRNRDLLLYNDLLNNPEVDTIVVDGFFGTGKTSNVMAHIVQYMQTAKQSNVYISKPHVPVGNSYGHLPGELKDKIHYEFKSYYQYIDRFWGQGMTEKLLSVGDAPNESMFAKEFGHIHLEALPFEYLRGLDLENAWAILDEAQNTTVQEMVTFVSRLLPSVKCVLLGDTSSSQVDRKSVLDPKRNGFAFIKEAYKDKPYSGIVELNTRNHILRGDRVKHLHDAIVRQNN